MQTQRLAPQHRTMLTISICAVMTACAPIPVDDERAKTSAYQRLSTYVSTGQKPEAPKTASAQQTQAPAAQPAPAPSVANIPSAPTTIATPAPRNTAPVATTAQPEATPEESKTLFGFISKLFDGKKADKTEPSTASSATQNSPSDQSASESAYSNPTSNNDPVSYSDADGAPVREKKSVFSGLFSRVKNVFNKNKTETAATDNTANNSAAENSTTESSTAAPAANYPASVAVAPKAAAAQAPRTSATNYNSTPARDRSARNIPSNAFSAANPIYITALDLSINNLSRRQTTNNFALDERGLAFLTKGALDEDSTYKFITEAQLAEQHKASRKQSGSRTLIEAMKDFMPQSGKNKLQDQMPKTMTLLNSIVVLKAPNGNGQQAIIMMKLKDNDTGIHLTDTRTTINLSAAQTQSSLAIKRAIGAELPVLLERLAKNAYESLTAPETNANEPDSSYLKSSTHQIASQQRTRQAPRTNSRVVDLSSKALAARNKQDSQYANSVVIDTSVGNQSRRAKTINTAPVYRLTAEEILNKEKTAATHNNQNEFTSARQAQVTNRELTAAGNPTAQAPRSVRNKDAVEQSIADRLSKQIANRRAQEQKTSVPTQSLSRVTPPPNTREFFGIQLMRATELSYLKDSLRKLSIDPRKVNIIRQKTKDSRIAYVAIYGQFDSQNAAQQTLDKLPEDALSEGAFVRRVSVKAPRT